jgi:hypothetical protein
LSSSQPSDSGGSVAVPRRTSVRIAAAIAALGVLALVSCKDDIAPPTLGRVEIRLASPTSGGIMGARIYWGDSLLVASVDRDAYSFILPAGAQTFRLEQDCSQITPEESRVIQVEPGRSETFSWSIAQSQAIEVISSMPGASIRLDGVDTGLNTPATIGCVQPGTHQVSVSLLGATAGADSAKTVEVGEGGVQVSFDLLPVPQRRTALLEIFTSTYCPFCATADAAAESLWTRVGPADGYIGVQVHTFWGGADSIATPTSIARDAFYGNMQDHGLPAAVAAGTELIRGIPNNATVETVVSTYRGALDPIRASDSAVAIHWLSANRVPGERVSGRARIICLQDLPEASAVEIVALTYKDGLVTRGAHGIDSFRHVVREFQSLGNAQTMELGHRGDWVDVDMTFDVSGDRRRGGSLWDESRMGLVLFLQNTATKEILQAGHTALP